MTFLAPSALFGVLLLAVPIVIHLLKPRKMRATPFSSLRWLRQSHQRLSRRIRWHQWLLFALRAGFLLVLVLALARPLFGPTGQARPADRFVLVDAGPGMTYRPAGQASAWDKAVQATGALVTNNRPGDRTALVLAAAPPQLLSPPVADASVHLPALRAAALTGADARLTAALPLVRSLLHRQPEGRTTELVLVTANRADAWQQAEIQEFLRASPPSLRVEVLDVGPATVQNGWVRDVRLLARDEEQRLRVELGCSGEGPQERRVRVSGIPELADSTRTVTLQSGKAAVLDFKLPRLAAQDSQAVTVDLEPADALPADDRFLVNVGASPALRVLLVESEAPVRAGPPTGLYLRTGLEALAAAGRHALVIVGRTAASISPADVDRADLVLLAGVPDLPEAVVQTLEKRVRAGAGLAVFLGDGLDLPFYGQRLFRPLQPEEGILPLPLKSSEDAFVRPPQPVPLAEIRWTHPLLAPLHDPIFGDLAQVRSQRHAVFAATAGARDTVLARFADGAPALVEHPLGSGRVLLFNTSANDSWSDLPRRRSFVPLLDRLVGYLTAGGVRHCFTAGEPVTLPLPEFTPGESVSVLTPDGSRHTPPLLTAGEQTLLHLDALGEAGLYRVERSSGHSLGFVVNASREQSRMTPMEPQVLQEWWKPVAVEVLDEEAAGERRAEAPAGWPLWPMLVLLAGLLLLVETVYVAVLCPRVNPAVVDSIVPRRGLLRPLAESPAETPAQLPPS